MKASKIYCRQIENADRTVCGYILNILHSGNVIEGYICCNERESEFFASGKSVKFSSENSAYLSASPKTAKAKKSAARLKLGCPLYSENGKFLGHIDDYTIVSDRITYAHIKNRKYPFGRIALGDVAILKNEKPLAEIAAKDLFIDAMVNAR